VLRSDIRWLTDNTTPLRYRACYEHRLPTPLLLPSPVLRREYVLADARLTLL